MNSPELTGIPSEIYGVTQFFNEYNEVEFLQPLAAEISWTKRKLFYKLLLSPQRKRLLLLQKPYRAILYATSSGLFFAFSRPTFEPPFERFWED